MITQESLDRAARYIQSLQGDAIWDRTPEKIKDRYRNKALKVRNLLEGVDETDGRGD